MDRSDGSVGDNDGWPFFRPRQITVAFIIQSFKQNLVRSFLFAIDALEEIPGREELALFIRNVQRTIASSRSNPSHPSRLQHKKAVYVLNEFLFILGTGINRRSLHLLLAAATSGEVDATEKTSQNTHRKL